MQAQLAVLQRWLPNVDPRRAIFALLEDQALGSFLGDARGHRELLSSWHEQWRTVLACACEQHGVCGEARARVLRLPLVGFYPAMRVALDALRGRWDPLAAAVLSQSGTVVSGWPPAVASRLEDIQRKCLDFLRLSPERARVTSLAVSFFLSRSAEEGAEYRQLLGIDIGSKTLCPPDAGPLEAVAAFGSVALTSYAATYGGHDGGQEATRPSS